MWRPTLAAAALGLLLAGCGHHTSQRAAVASYLKQVNRVERTLAPPLGTVTSVGTQFAQEQRAGGTLTGLLTAGHEARLLAALSHIRASRARLAALAVPRQATRLRTLLLQVIDGQVRLTRELAQLIVFLPRFSTALRPLAPATRRLEVTLSRQTALGSAGVLAVYAEKAAALRRFRAAVQGILKQLTQLRPPAFQRPAYEAQLVSLRGMSRSAGQLADALQAGPKGNVQPILSRFDHAAAYTQSVAVQKAQIAAIRGYDRQALTVAKLSQAAEEERLRLANNLA
jgi:hypothetical protein